MNKAKKRLYEVDPDKRKKRRQTHTRSDCSFTGSKNDEIVLQSETDISTEQTEIRQVFAEMAQSFIGTINFYKADYGGSHPHDEAVKKALEINEWRRNYIESLEPEEIEWGHILAVGEINQEDSYKLWSRVRENAADELESGRRTAKVVGVEKEPFEMAQFLAIRDAFADEWQPRGGIESAMIDMMTVAFSLQIYWATIAHQRAVKIHNEQRKELNRYENKGWKSPYQYEAEAVEQAHRLADSYNRQFLRVLRQLRDLRRYSPVIIQNNGGQVNIAEQQMNAQKNG